VTFEERRRKVKIKGEFETQVSSTNPDFSWFYSVRDWSVSTVTGLRVPSKVRGCLFATAQNGSGSHPASYPMGTGGSSPEVNQPGREADRSCPSSAEAKNAWRYNSNPHTPS